MNCKKKTTLAAGRSEVECGQGWVEIQGSIFEASRWSEVMRCPDSGGTVLYTSPIRDGSAWFEQARASVTFHFSLPSAAHAIDTLSTRHQRGREAGHAGVGKRVHASICPRVQSPACHGEGVDGHSADDVILHLCSGMKVVGRWRQTLMFLMLWLFWLSSASHRRCCSALVHEGAIAGALPSHTGRIAGHGSSEILLLRFSWHWISAPSSARGHPCIGRTLVLSCLQSTLWSAHHHQRSSTLPARADRACACSIPTDFHRCEEALRQALRSRLSSITPAAAHSPIGPPLIPRPGLHDVVHPSLVAYRALPAPRF